MMKLAFGIYFRRKPLSCLLPSHSFCPLWMQWRKENVPFVLSSLPAAHIHSLLFAGEIHTHTHTKSLRLSISQNSAAAAAIDGHRLRRLQAFLFSSSQGMEHVCRDSSSSPPRAAAAAENASLVSVPPSFILSLSLPSHSPFTRPVLNICFLKLCLLFFPFLSFFLPLQLLESKIVQSQSFSSA